MKLKEVKDDDEEVLEKIQEKFRWYIKLERIERERSKHLSDVIMDMAGKNVLRLQKSDDYIIPIKVIVKVNGEWHPREVFTVEGCKQFIPKIKKLYDKYRQSVEKIEEYAEKQQEMRKKYGLKLYPRETDV